MLQIGRHNQDGLLQYLLLILLLLAGSIWTSTFEQAQRTHNIIKTGALWILFHYLEIFNNAFEELVWSWLSIDNIIF
jgi:hypothetical protein